MAEKKTSNRAATAASKTLQDGRTSKASKSAAGSALSQVNAGRKTGTRAAQDASDVLQSSDTGKTSRRSAASTLSQKKK
ncbi:hypothetical protein GCM10008955_33160 [Deinococcus malanensis]|uniref:SMP domain-containing protein n=1 Tax=Deinococcus malanensis TaxID=1706855 RepID=A0ABQ2F144_9DEIO|nr:hypothetical protein GCM10008955_33160 [Deinococcus malanensis]